MKAALDRNDLPLAMTLAGRAIDAGAEDSLVFNVAAHGLQMERRYSQAMDLLVRASRLTPNDPYVMISIGQLLSQQGRFEEAERPLRSALSINPDLPAALQGLGVILDLRDDPEAARRCFEHAMRVAPEFPDPVGCLALQALARKDFVAAEALARKALALDPRETSGLIALAHLDREAGQLADAEAHARAALAKGEMPPLHESSVWRLLGDILDDAGRFEDAFAAYDAGNQLFRRTYTPKIDERNIGPGVDFVQRLQRDFDARRDADWSAAAIGRGPDEPRVHVFLAGYFRSGTTLLEQILASHPEVEAMEERTILDDVAWPFFSTADGLDRLAALTAQEAEELRAEYWRRIALTGQPVGDGVFVDKLPFAALWSPFIAKVFPEAKILWARRDPRDVVLSCFRTRFRAGPLQLEMADIERGAMLYAAMMSLFEAYFERLPLARHVLRHEALVSDFDAEIESACGFLGIEMHPRMREFAETAKHRNVRTPSARQVVQGLNNRGVGRWRAYAKGLAPALSILRPWVERYRYPAE
ncbi:MAG TPA: sulfotransferase [Caulobacteraceae bacterium]|nr:sulfotransferase [Caulobacteraceae bacterium]